MIYKSAMDFPIMYEVRSTEMLELGEAGLGSAAIKAPIWGAIEYVTVVSAQEPITALTFPATEEPSLDTDNFSIAELIWAFAGMAERLNRSRPRCVAVLLRINMVTALPKLVVGWALST